MTELIERLIANQAPAAQEDERWGEIALHIDAYLSPELPPASLVTSARSVVIRDGSLLVFWDDKDCPQILVGGRCEPGETFEQTLCREALEEAGVEVADLTLLGFLHYRHLGPKPPSYTYPYPSFFQVVFGSRARSVSPEAVTYDEYVSRSTFLPIEQALALPLRNRDQPFLTDAISRLT